MFRSGRRWILFFTVTVLSVWAGCDRPTSESPAPKPPPPPTTRPAIDRDRDRDIRVLLADGITQSQMIVSGAFDLVDADRGTSLAEGVSCSRLTVQFSADAIAFAELGRSFQTKAVEIVPRHDRPISVSSDQQWRRYPGRMCVYLNPEGTGAVVNTLDVEEYLVSVVASEAHPNFHPEAQRAQAVACRTYAWYHKRTTPVWRRWDVVASEGSQVYVGLITGVTGRRAALAVEGTCGVVCTWMSPRGERIFCSYFSSTCGGYTQAAGPVKNVTTIPPLSGNMKCDYCRHSPWYEWSPVGIDKKTVTERLRQKYPKFKEIGPIEQIKVANQTEYGRPVRLHLLDARGRGIQLEAENFRLTVDPKGRDLRSTFFKIRDDGNKFSFVDGKGFGHGLGLCQYGADGMARAGANAAYILRYYYPQSHLKRAY